MKSANDAPQMLSMVRRMLIQFGDEASQGKFQSMTPTDSEPRYLQIRPVNASNSGSTRVGKGRVADGFEFLIPRPTVVCLAGGQNSEPLWFA